MKLDNIYEDLNPKTVKQIVAEKAVDLKFYLDKLKAEPDFE